MRPPEHALASADVGDMARYALVADERGCFVKDALYEETLMAGKVMPEWYHHSTVAIYFIAVAYFVLTSALAWRMRRVYPLTLSPPWMPWTLGLSFLSVEAGAGLRDSLWSPITYPCDLLLAGASLFVPALLGSYASWFVYWHRTVVLQRAKAKAFSADGASTGASVVSVS